MLLSALMKASDIALILVILAVLALGIVSIFFPDLLAR